LFDSESQSNDLEFGMYRAAIGQNILPLLNNVLEQWSGVNG